MGTRSRIAIENSDKTIESIYCHWDGYVEHNGAILQKFYNQQHRVRQLIGLGGLSLLGENIIPDSENSFDNYPAATCVPYTTRGEELVVTRSKDIKCLTRWMKDSWEEYLYLFRDGSWLVSTDNGKNFSVLADELEKSVTAGNQIYC